MRVNRAWLGLIVLMLPTLLVAMDMTALLLALPRLSAGLGAVLVALVFAGIAMAGTGLTVAQHLQSVLGFSPVASAVLFTPMGLGVAAGTMAAPTLAGAVAASRHLPASQSAELLHTAREAFTVSLHVTGVVAAAIFAGPAVLILAMRPATRPVPAALPDYEATRS